MPRGSTRRTTHASARAGRADTPDAGATPPRGRGRPRRSATQSPIRGYNNRDDPTIPSPEQRTDRPSSRSRSPARQDGSPARGQAAAGGSSRPLLPDNVRGAIMAIMIAFTSVPLADSIADPTRALRSMMVLHCRTLLACVHAGLEAVVLPILRAFMSSALHIASDNG